MNKLLEDFKLKKKYIYILTIISAIVLLTIIWYTTNKVHKNEMSSSLKSEETEYSNKFINELASSADLEDLTEKESNTWKVYITGEVNTPGVYDVDMDNRIQDVVEMAGGLTNEADIESVNFAAYVKDEQHIIIHKIGESVDKTQNSIQNSNGENLININTADKEELKKLSGIGDVIAENIIRYRETNGKFNSIEEIKNVSRIGSKLYEQIKDDITI